MRTEDHHCDEKEYGLLNREMVRLFMKLFRLNRFSVLNLPFYLKTIARQFFYARKRRINKKAGLHVPPFIIFSVTHQCNLQCKGCYLLNQKRNNLPELKVEKATQFLHESRELGISVALIVGGEPLLRKDLMMELSRHRKMIFAVFTNGTLLRSEYLDYFAKNRHAIPILSVEGSKEQTDWRRGTGMFDQLMDTSGRLERKKLIYGISITLTSGNFETVTNREFIQTLSQRGCSILFYVEYVPVEEGTEHLCISDGQRDVLREIEKDFRDRHNMLFLSFPSGEERFGGCLAAGRGFIHVNAQGGIEPCPFAPFSDSNLENLNLREALSSDVLRLIRENSSVLETGEGGCSLWENRDKVRNILAKTGKRQ